MKLEGSVALVTGGASGLGAATARALSDQGARLVLTDLPERQALAEDLLAELGSGRFVAADVVNTDEVASVIAAAREDGPLRVCVNCAGIGPRRRVIARDGSPHS